MDLLPPQEPEPETIVANPIRAIPKPRLSIGQRNFVLAVSGTACFGFVLWGINQFLSLRGVVHVLASRIVLTATVAVGILGWLSFTRLFPKLKNISFGLGVIVMVLLGVWFDRWAPKPQPQVNEPNTKVIQHPAEKPNEAQTPSRRKTTEPKNPNRDLVKQTREIAKKAKSIHDQLESDLKGVRTRMQLDIENSRMDLHGEAREQHDEMVRRAWQPDEKRVRENAENQYVKCCEKAALSLREELMLKCPSLSKQDTLKDFSGEYDGLRVQRNLASYSTIGDELNSLANALENGNCRYK